MRINLTGNRATDFTKIEFWAAITLFALPVFAIIFLGLVSNTFANGFPAADIIQSIIVFGGFMSLNFLVVPAIVKKQRLFINILLLAAIFIAVFVGMGVCDTYIKLHLYVPGRSRDQAHDIIFGEALVETILLFLLFLVYTFIRYGSLYLLANAERIRDRFRFVTYAGLVALVIHTIVLFLLLAFGVPWEICVGWTVTILSGILLYWFSFHRLIPGSLKERHPLFWYVGKVFLVLLASFLPIAIVIVFFARSDDAAFGLSFQNCLFQFFITMPLTWLLYKRYMKGNETLVALRTELGRSNANLDFLRSQINPHFLFNALNNIYGTAIQEKAERTSEGIERLSEMMRFMLQENMKDKISIGQEIQYLENFISLQRLRTDPIPGIDIKVHIQDSDAPFQIAPMLLIPFVENAFKHGISFREPSHIKVTFEIKDNTIYFDVDNSKHRKTEQDPERDKSGIGLENVKQRLKLLYPNKHELLIRDTSKSFFIHLTIQLK